MTFDIATASSDSFLPLVGQRFTVDASEGPVAMTLDNVKVFHGSMVRDTRVEIDGTELPARKAFALTLEGPVTPELPPGTYTIRNQEMGAQTLLLSPFRRDADCVLYEVVFN